MNLDDEGWDPDHEARVLADWNEAFQKETVAFQKVMRKVEAIQGVAMPPGVRKSEYWKEYKCIRCGRMMSARRLQFVGGPDLRECRGRIDCNATIKIQRERAMRANLDSGISDEKVFVVTQQTGDTLMHNNTYEARAARLRAQSEHLASEADRLETLGALRPVEPTRYEDENGVVQNPIIRFHKRFSSDPGARSYAYAAIGVPMQTGNRLDWYTTGPRNASCYTWDDLMDWLGEKDWHSVEQM